MLRRRLHLGALVGFCALLLPPLATATPSKVEREAAGKLIVHFNRSVPAARRSELLAQAGATPARTISKLGAVVARVAPARRAAALATLRASGAAQYVQGVHVFRASAVVPTDPDYVSQPWPWTVPGFPDAWGVTTGAPSVVVAVLDTGVFAGSNDLTGRVLAGYDEVNQDNNPDDDQGHGTEVATTLAGEMSNGFGAVGACPQCSILPVKVLDDTGAGSDDTIIDGIVYAVQNGARIINLSLGGSFNDPALWNAVAWADSQNVLVVAAAGNSASSQPVYPGAYAGVISVGASDTYGYLMDFSQSGPWVDVAAPGCVNAGTRTNSVANVCGTSFAAPLTAGLAGLLLASNPGWTAAQLRSRIESTAMVTGADVRNGMIDAGNALGVPAAPWLLSLPSIAGAAQSGQTLTAVVPRWMGSAPLTSSLQWYRCPSRGGFCSPVPGATGTAYPLTDADIGFSMTFMARATNPLGTFSQQASFSEFVVSAFAPPPAPEQPPASVPGTPPASSNSGTTTPKTLPPPLVVAPSLPPQLPSIVGTPAPGERLSANPGSVGDALGVRIAFTWQVLRSGAWRPIPRASDQDFDVPTSFAGLKVRVLVTSRNASGAVQRQSASDAVTIKAPKTVKKLKR